MKVLRVSHHDFDYVAKKALVTLYGTKLSELLVDDGDVVKTAQEARSRKHAPKLGLLRRFFRTRRVKRRALSPTYLNEFRSSHPIRISHGTPSFLTGRRQVLKKRLSETEKRSTRRRPCVVEQLTGRIQTRARTAPCLAGKAAPRCSDVLEGAPRQ